MLKNLYNIEEAEEIEEKAPDVKQTEKSGNRNVARSRQQSNNKNQQPKNAEEVTEELTDFTVS